MEFNQSSPHQNFEMPQSQGSERRPLDGSFEVSNDSRIERQEVQPSGSSAAPAAPMLPPPIIAVQPGATSSVSDTLQRDDNPVAAADEDLIEKEWVDRAKKIIATTRDDPHRREQEVGMLQADYLRKRYGKDVSVNGQNE